MFMETNLINDSSSPGEAMSMCTNYSALICLPQFCKLTDPDFSAYVQLRFKKSPFC